LTDYSDYWYHSSDGLRLYARDYPCSDTALAAIDAFLSQV